MLRGVVQSIESLAGVDGDDEIKNGQKESVGRTQLMDV
jgi:hypothetical protein